MSLALTQHLKLKQELTLEQKQKQEVKQELKLTQKLELKLYLKVQEYFQGLYDKAEKGAYERHGINFEYAVIRKKDLPSNFPVDAGFCLIYYDFLTGEATKTLRFVVKDACKPFPGEYQGIVAVHEYGESLLIGHQESSVLEWGTAKREGFLGSYLEWMEGAAPAKLADLSKYSVLWDMMPDEVTAAAEKMLMESEERKRLLEIMKGLQMPEEVRISCARFGGFKSHAKEVIDIVASRALIIMDEALTQQERMLAGRYALQSVAAQLAKKGQPWLAHAMGESWKEAVEMVNADYESRITNARKAMVERLVKAGSESETDAAREMLADYEEPLVAVLPGTLQQAMELERMVAKVDARIIRSMSAQEVLREYLRLAGAEARKRIKGEDGADTPVQRGVKRFIASYALLRGIAKISELELDFESAGEMTPRLERWWRDSIKAMDRRYAKDNGGKRLFGSSDPLLAKGLR